MSLYIMYQSNSQSKLLFGQFAFNQTAKEARRIPAISPGLSGQDMEPITTDFIPGFAIPGVKIRVHKVLIIAEPNVAAINLLN